MVHAMVTSGLQWSQLSLHLQECLDHASRHWSDLWSILLLPHYRNGTEAASYCKHGNYRGDGFLS
jgi:hypothetical protein